MNIISQNYILNKATLKNYKIDEVPYLKLAFDRCQITGVRLYQDVLLLFKLCVILINLNVLTTVNNQHAFNQFSLFQAFLYIYDAYYFNIFIRKK